ncbi:unnamed protein product [marine sediment metagenome]|uniref:Uncharacterized protein n=1 Tax=marine sediment metagenome TaxID=412755 RepID=X1PVU4_9ZZZZ
MIQWQIFPKSQPPTSRFEEVIGCFEKVESMVSSDNRNLNSDQVLVVLRPHLEQIGFRVEAGRRKGQKIRVPVLFGRQGKWEKSFEVDAHNEKERVILEVEAGRAVDNYQFLKDLFEACMAQDVDHLVIAVRNIYGGNKDFEAVINYFETLYASGRMKLPLKAVLVIGY